MPEQSILENSKYPRKTEIKICSAKQTSVTTYQLICKGIKPQSVLRIATNCGLCLHIVPQKTTKGDLDMSQDNKTTSVRISEEIRKRLAEQKKKTGVSITFMIEKAIEEYLEKRGL